MGVRGIIVVGLLWAIAFSGVAVGDDTDHFFKTETGQEREIGALDSTFTEILKQARKDIEAIDLATDEAENAEDTRESKRVERLLKLWKDLKATGKSIPNINTIARNLGVKSEALSKTAAVLWAIRQTETKAGILALTEFPTSDGSSDIDMRRKKAAERVLEALMNSDENWQFIAADVAMHVGPNGPMITPQTALANLVHYRSLLGENNIAGLILALAHNKFSLTPEMRKEALQELGLIEPVKGDETLLAYMKAIYGGPAEGLNSETPKLVKESLAIAERYARGIHAARKTIFTEDAQGNAIINWRARVYHVDRNGNTEEVDAGVWLARMQADAGVDEMTRMGAGLGGKDGGAFIAAAHANENDGDPQMEFRVRGTREPGEEGTAFKTGDRLMLDMSRGYAALADQVNAVLPTTDPLWPSTRMYNATTESASPATYTRFVVGPDGNVTSAAFTRPTPTPSPTAGPTATPAPPPVTVRTDVESVAPHLARITDAALADPAMASKYGTQPTINFDEPLVDAVATHMTLDDVAAKLAEGKAVLWGKDLDGDQLVITGVSTDPESKKRTFLVRTVNDKKFLADENMLVHEDKLRQPPPTPKPVETKVPERTEATSAEPYFAKATRVEIATPTPPELTWFEKVGVLGGLFMGGKKETEGDRTVALTPSKVVTLQKKGETLDGIFAQIDAGNQINLVPNDGYKGYERIIGYDKGTKVLYLLKAGPLGLVSRELYTIPYAEFETLQKFEIELPD